VRKSGRPTDEEVYKSFKSFISLENQSRFQRGEQPLCTPTAGEKAFQKLLRLSRDEEERKWEIDEGVWDEAMEGGELNGEFGWYVGFDDKKFDNDPENLDALEDGIGDDGVDGGVRLGVNELGGRRWEDGMMNMEGERDEREMKIGVGRADREGDRMLGERLVDGVGRRAGKRHLRKDSIEGYSGM
jgi:hypothetical protein